MSVVVPADLPAVAELTGSPEEVTAFADDLLSVAVTLDDLDTTAGANATYEGWEGDAADGYGSYVRAAAENAQTMSLALRAVALAADTYALELQRLQTEQERLVDARTTLHADCDGLRTSLATATPEEIPWLELVAQGYAARRSDIVAEVGTMLADVEANATALREALEANADVATVLAAPGAGVDPADAAMTLPGAPGSGASPEEVAQWWESLSAEQRYAVLAAHPEVIGAADGLPAQVRDEANRARLTADLEALELLETQGRLPADLRDTLDNARAAEEALGNLVVDPVTGEVVPPLLHVYDPDAFDGEGTVAIAYGDPDTADNIAAIVPGTTVKGTSITSDVNNAENVYTSARVSDPDATTAAIIWIGYDSPEFLDGTVASEDMAVAGGERLSDYIDGLNAARPEGDDAHTTVIGHSYGSTTVGRAAVNDGLAGVDDIVAVGSPGLGDGVDSADDLGGAEVWSGNSSRDPVARLADNGWIGLGTVGGGLGNDVAEEGFGANRFRAEDVTRDGLPIGLAAPIIPIAAPIVDNFDGTNIADHSKYFNDGTESLHNIGHIVAGNDDQVSSAEQTYDPWYSGVVDPEYDRTPQEQDRIVVAPGE